MRYRLIAAAEHGTGKVADDAEARQGSGYSRQSMAGEC